MADKPAIVLSFDPAGTKFPITEQAETPKITVTATLQNVTPDPKKPLLYNWKVTLVFNGQACNHSLSRVIKHPDIAQSTPTNKFTIPFAYVRGGDLSVSVSVMVGNTTVTAQSDKLQVTATNPSIKALQGTVPANDAFRKLMRVESALRQFLSEACPLFSSDNLGGVGLCQITSPAPTDDQVWSWKENVKAGWALYKSKEAAALSWMKATQKGNDFNALVKAYNDARAAKAKAAASAAPPAGGSPPAAGAGATPPKPLMIELPDFTADQLQRDTIRGFNGWAGQLHEFRPKVDKDGLLVVKEDPGGTKGTAEWEEISAEDRIKYYDSIKLAAGRRGDPDYVEDVMKKASF